MKIGKYIDSNEAGLVGVGATVEWEECDRPPLDLHFRTDPRYGDGLWHNPNAFLLASIFPAMHRGERRVLVEGKVCPELRNGLATAMLYVRQMSHRNRLPSIEIEATQGFEPAQPLPKPRGACFLSGGVNSLATLRCNRTAFPLSHPHSVRDALFVDGFERGGDGPPGDTSQTFRSYLPGLTKLAADTSAELIPVYTNLRRLEDDAIFFAVESGGAAMAAVAHVLSRRITTAFVASSVSLHDHGLLASSPLLDPGFAGSADLRIAYDGSRLRRLEKIGLISDWDAALQILRVCNDPFLEKGVLNCGRCGKCVLTMIGLLVFDRLVSSGPFETDDVTLDLLQAVGSFAVSGPSKDSKARLVDPLYAISTNDVDAWRELVDPLRRIGRTKLSEAIKTKLSDYDQNTHRMTERGGRGLLSRFDRKWLGGAARHVLRGDG